MVSDDDFDLARFGIDLVIFRDLLCILNLVEIKGEDRENKIFRLKNLGRKIIYFQIKKMKHFFY
ncbi:MAG: hypothetical protein AAB526_01865 [Patescibacteria group bacterium]